MFFPILTVNFTKKFSNDAPTIPHIRRLSKAGKNFIACFSGLLGFVSIEEKAARSTTGIVSVYVYCSH